MAVFPFHPFIVTDAHMAMHWSGAKDGRWFRCHLCGHWFSIGDRVRAVYSNFEGSPFHGNPLVCETPCGAVGDAEVLAELGRRLRAIPWWACPWGTEPPGRPAETDCNRAKAAAKP